MTLVWTTNTGSLIQTQVQTQDVVNTYSAARAVYGWMGGLDGVMFLLSQIPNPFRLRIKELKFDQTLRLLPVRGHVFTSGGHLIAEIDNARESFGGDICTQLIGTTICALSHECEIMTAARLFNRFLLPYLFGQSSPVTDALQSQIMENSNLQKIVNEGASRGWPNTFLDTIRARELPEANQGWRYTTLNQSDHEDDDFGGETNMIAGLLKWIAKDEVQEYRTRSGCVARVAACLKVVGYSISSIQTWSGIGLPPRSNGPKTVTLVLGGSSETDTMMQELQQLSNTPRILHYQFKTLGSMLLGSLGNAPDLHPAVLQEDFEWVFEYIEEQLSVQFIDGDTIKAKYQWKHIDKSPKAIAMSLASIHFSECAEFVAPCYDRIANEQYLDGVRGKSKNQIKPKAKYKELARFRAITASIVISIVSRFAPTSFKLVHHATVLDLSSPFWLSMMCNVIDKAEGSSSWIPLCEAVVTLAIVHAAYDPPGFRKGLPDVDKNIIAWRNGIYGVVPALLLNMSVLKEELPLVCIDYFWANVKVLEDGSIRAANVPLIDRHELDIESTDTNLSTLQRLDKPRLGDPERSTADLPLYLSLGTPLHHGEPELCFTAWLHGSIAGTVSIQDVLRALVLSRVEPTQCPGHDKVAQVLNIKTSIWSADVYSKPMTKDYPIFVPVSEDHCWALFLAGQMYFERGRVVYRCVGCAVENFQNNLKLESGSDRAEVLIGFL